MGVCVCVCVWVGGCVGGWVYGCALVAVVCLVKKTKKQKRIARHY